MVAELVLQYAQAQGITNVGVIVADYAWGQAVKSAVENTFAGSGVDIGEVQVAPVPPTTDFTPFVRAVADAGAEMIMATGHPPGNGSIVTLSADLAGNVPVTGAWTPPNTVIGSPRRAWSMKFGMARPSCRRIRGPNVLKIRTIRVSTPW